MQVLLEGLALGEILEDRHYRNGLTGRVTFDDRDRDVGPHDGAVLPDVLPVARVTRQVAAHNALPQFQAPRDFIRNHEVRDCAADELLSRIHQ